MPESDHPGSLTYRAAGVDIDAGNEAVRRIRALVARTRRPEQIDDLGGFAGMMALPLGMAEPVLVSCTDGVGTKLLVAIALGRHDTVGIDLVAMNVNDLICTGARPLFVLDYIASGRLDPDAVEAIVTGIVEGCVQSRCALLGGETAELPGMYADGHYDLAAFAVGVVDRRATWGPHRVRVGDVLLALPSSGLHSNGYSLARKALLDPAYGGFGLDTMLPGGEGVTVGEALLVPTRIYVTSVLALHGLGDAIRSAAHITGGGLLENPPRAVRDEHAVRLDLREVPLPPVLRAIAEQGVETVEMRRTFNMGIGMLLVCDPARVSEARTTLERAGQPSYVVGTVAERRGASVEFIGD